MDKIDTYYNLCKETNEITSITRTFKENQSKDLARKIIEKLNALKNMPKGCFVKINAENVDAEIQKYTKYILGNQ